MKSLIVSFSVLLLTSFALAEAPPVVLEDGKEFYEIGLNLDLLEDPTGKLTIDDVDGPQWAGKFKKLDKKITNLGFIPSAFWARVRVHNKASRSGAWIFSQNFALQDSVILFKKVGGKWKSISTGDTTPFKTREIEDKSFSFEINPAKDTLYYMRIKGVISQFNLTISSPKTFSEDRTSENLFSGLYFGLVIAMFFYNLLVFIFIKNINYLYYILYVFSFGFVQFILQGFSQRFLFSDSLWIANHGLIFFISTMGIFFGLFSRNFLNLKEAAPKLDRVALSFILIFTSFIPFSFVPVSSFNMKVLFLVSGAFMFYFFLCALIRVKMRYRPAYFYLTACTFSLSGGIIYVLGSMGILPTNLFTLNAPYIGCALELILLPIALTDRFNFQKEQLEREQNTTHRLKLEKIELEKKKIQHVKRGQEDKSLFFAKLSHELRTPLNAILGFSGLLLRKIKNEKGSQEKEFLELIYSSGKSLLHLVNSVHDFTKIDLDEFKVIKKKMPLIKFLKEISLYYTNECEKKGLNFSLELDDDLPQWIESDKQRLRQVFDNLLGNALKFTEKGHIKIIAKTDYFGLEKDKVDLIFQIEDTGRGVDQEKFNKLFKTFSQVHDEGSVQEIGTGLGLFISDKIIQKIGGWIEVYSEIGKWSIFTITFKDVTICSGEGEQKENVSYKFFGDTLLLADDAPINVTLLESYLLPYDLKIVTAKNGEELIDKAKKLDPSLIITDFKMPVFNGRQALEQLKKDNIHIPMILISALKVEDDIKKEFQGFLQKPVEEGVFIEEISRFLKHEREKQE